MVFSLGVEDLTHQQDCPYDKLKVELTIQGQVKEEVRVRNRVFDHVCPYDKLKRALVDPTAGFVTGVNRPDV